MTNGEAITNYLLPVTYYQLIMSCLGRLINGNASYNPTIQAKNISKMKK